MTERGGKPGGQGMRPTVGAGPGGRARRPGSARVPPSEGLAWPTTGAYAVTPLPGLAGPGSPSAPREAAGPATSRRQLPPVAAAAPLAQHASAVTEEDRAAPEMPDLMQALAGTQGRAALLEAPFAAMPETMPPPPFCPVLPAEDASAPPSGRLAARLARVLARLTGRRARPAS